MTSNQRKTAKVIPLDTEDIYPYEQDRSLFLQRAMSLIDEADKVISNQIEETIKYREMNEYRSARFIIFPDDTFKLIWDIVILVLMMYTITLTPYRVAFIDSDTSTWMAIDYLIDSLFMTDVVLNCFMAYVNTDEVLVTSHWKIFKNYLKTWMIFDVASSIPTQAIFENSGWGTLLRLSKLPRLYRLVKILKLVRLFKVLKNRNKVLSCLECFSKLSIGMERLVYFSLSILAICHLFACGLYFVASFNSDNVNNWVYKYGIVDLSLEEKYLASVYWTVTTLCTIGYGDVTPASDVERAVVVFVELAGVFFYSYTIGTITSLMADMDKKKAKLDAKLIILQDIAKKYNLSRVFYEKLKTALEYNQSTLNKERNEIITNLPKKLAMQLNIVMNRGLIDKNKFFIGKQVKFITTVIDYLKPFKVKAKDIIYKKGEFTEEMFFIKSGEVAIYEDTKPNELVLETLNEGDYFGDIEIFLSEIRYFSAKALKSCELFTLSREDLFTNVLHYFDKIKCEMIVEANFRKDAIFKIRENLNGLEKSLKDVEDNTRRKLLSTPEESIQEYAVLRKTLAPTSRAMLDENEDASIIEVMKKIDMLSKILTNLEAQLFGNDKTEEFQDT